MKIKQLAFVAGVCVLLAGCGGDSKANENSGKTNTKPTTQEVKKESDKTVENSNSDPMQNKGVGPIKSVTLGEIDSALAEEGKKLFKDNCKACHKIKKRYIGPALQGVTKRRSPEWIMNMILNPEKMVAEDPIAKKLLAEYNAPMSNQNLTEEQARAILEYFRTLES